MAQPICYNAQLSCIFYVLSYLYSKEPLPPFSLYYIVCSTNLINIYILIFKKASDFHKTNSFELFMILADISKRKKRLTIFYTKKNIQKLTCLLITIKPEHLFSCIESSKMYVRAEALTDTTDNLATCLSKNVYTSVIQQLKMSAFSK